jgi:hypothetical protein
MLLTMINLESPKSFTNPPWLRLGKATLIAAALASGLVASTSSGAVVTDVRSLNIAAGGKLDVTGNSPATTAGVLAATKNAVIVRAPNTATQGTNITSIRGWVNTGYAGGAWTGTGITSGTAALDAQSNGVLGVMMYDNTQLGYTNFAGVTGLDSDPLFNQTMLRMTYTGDYDASGKVDGGDYGLLDFYLGSGLIAQGDINADGLVDGGDYGLVDFVLGSQVYGNLGSSVVGPGPAPGASPAAVPEPVSGAFLLTGTALLLASRKRK